MNKNELYQYRYLLLIYLILYNIYFSDRDLENRNIKLITDSTKLVKEDR